MNNLDNKLEKLEQFRKFVEERARKAIAGQKPQADRKPAQPAAGSEPVSARIGPPLSQAAGSVSQIDRSSVIAAPRPVQPASGGTPVTKAPSVEEHVRPVDEDIPEIEDYLPWLKEERARKTEVTEEPTVAASSSTSMSEAVEKPAVTAADVSPDVSPPASSSPRSYVPSVNVPARDRVMLFEGTGEPRPILREGQESREQEESYGQCELELEAAVGAGPESSTEDILDTKASEGHVTTPAPGKRAKRPAAGLEQPAAPPLSFGSQNVRDLWDRLPRHIQLLMGTQPKEVAQHSYKNFKESRSDLIRRLLDPPLSLEEAARILNVCPTTVRRYTNRGVLPHSRTAGNQRRFRLSDVLAFFETMSVGHQDQTSLEGVPE